jgi:hypothetical protein
MMGDQLGGLAAYSSCLCGHFRGGHDNEIGPCRDAYKASDGRWYPCQCDAFRITTQAIQEKK